MEPNTEVRQWKVTVTEHLRQRDSETCAPALPNLTQSSHYIHDIITTPTSSSHASAQFNSKSSLNHRFFPVCSEACIVTPQLICALDV
jgi:hypothetical protein